MIPKIKVSKSFLLLSIFLITSIHSQNINFKNLTTKDGLSNNKINAILQDKTGFLWFGTDDGLNRFDGYEFNVYRNSPTDSNSLSNNSVWSLFEDKEGYIWIGTKSGELNRYNPKLDNFKHWSIKSSSVAENSINAIYKDQKGLLWVGTYQSGLYRLDTKNGEVKNWNYKTDDPNCISNNFITSIVEDINGNLWISTYNGLNKFNPNSNDDIFTKFYYEQGNENSLSSNLTWSITESEYDSNIMWAGTANGLVSFDINKNKFTRIPFTKDNSLQFGSSVASVVEEKNNDEPVLWISTYGGLVRLNLQTKESLRFIKQKNETSSIISNEINSVIKDRSGVIWLATENGLSYFSQKSMKFNNFFTEEGGISQLGNLMKTNVKAVCEDSDGTVFFGTSSGVFSYEHSNKKNGVTNSKSTDGINVWSLAAGFSNDLWIGTYGQGLKQLNIKSGAIKNWTIESPTFKTSAFDYLKSLYLDESNDLWIGFWGGGLSKFDTKTGKYKIWITESDNPKSISHNDVWTLHKDKKGRLWVGTNGGGLNLFDESDGSKFHRWIEVLDKSKQLSSNSIYSICESTNEAANTILWVGTSNGLNKIVIKNSTDLYNFNSHYIEVQSFGAQNGLADNAVKSILEDKNGNLWIGTNSGISFFDVENEEFINYSNSDGIIGSEFNSGAAFYSDEGTMYFGSVDGLNIIKPDQIKQSTFIPPIIISDFQIFNQSVSIGGDSPLTKPIQETEEITLSYSQNVFSFQFSALDYNSPSAIQYAYQMEGFDADWINSEGRRFVTYTNLNPGNYEFKVKSTNSDGVWCDNTKSISVIINSPWWRTGWAYTAYILLIISGLFIARKVENNRSNLRNELKMREFETRKQRELEIMKSRFFANLSHEFRTPLTLIRGPIEELISSKSDKNQKEYLELIKRNSDKLQELIDQLLELTQLENAAIPLNAKQENLVTCLRGIFFSFESLAKEKGIELSFHSDLENILSLIDTDKLEKIINNLLSNAFKFTPRNGSITVSVERRIIDDGKFVSVKIADTGIGIPEDKLQHIFDRFYQVDDSSRKKYGGSGIGLALVKELVDLNHWQIDVRSELGEGTEFELIIPIFDDSRNETENKFDADGRDLTDKLNQGRISIPKDEIIEKELEQEILEKKKLLGEKPTLLIVEDSDDVRIFLKGILQNEYLIVEAVDGKDGLKKATEIMPALIISDVMMPSMNGLEFSKQIKTEIQTSHIPVILLTAKASQESKIKGLETGADDYLTKPFNSKELLVRVKNLLDQRKKLREKFSKEVKIDTSAVTSSSLDDEFLQKALVIAEKNISNTEFSSDEFAKEMYLSRSQLHRKLIAITGQAPGEFIRNFRLKKAASLILEKRLSITQISFEVGFNSPSHFTKAFRNLFNCLPTEFIERNNS